MPVLERDPWRYQYFADIPCPGDVFVPTDDPDCWELYPEWRWIYDKLRIAEGQGIACGNGNQAPECYPVFSKPKINLKGMGLESGVISSREEFETKRKPGHIWMEFLRGEHVSTDCAVVDGEVTWMRHATGIPWREGMFKYWIIRTDTDAMLSAYLQEWVARHMRGYTGMVNFETIGGRIIEAHLRFADQWCDLYGEGWIESLIGLYATGNWSFRDQDRIEGYSVPLFARHGNVPPHPAEEFQAEIRARPEIASLQITYHENRDSRAHPMPPGGFRLSIINCTNLAAGFQARRDIAASFAGVEIMIPE
jgi:hypothetical protein